MDIIHFRRGTSAISEIAHKAVGTAMQFSALMVFCFATHVHITDQNSRSSSQCWPLREQRIIYLSVLCRSMNRPIKKAAEKYETWYDYKLHTVYYCMSKAAIGFVTDFVS